MDDILKEKLDSLDSGLESLNDLVIWDVNPSSQSSTKKSVLDNPMESNNSGSITSTNADIDQKNSSDNTDPKLECSEPSTEFQGSYVGDNLKSYEESRDLPISKENVPDKIETENTEKMLSELLEAEKNHKIQEFKKRRMIRVSLPENEGFVTLEFVKQLTLQQVLNYILNKRKLKMGSSIFYYFKYPASKVPSPLISTSIVSSTTTTSFFLSENPNIKKKYHLSLSYPGDHHSFQQSMPSSTSLSLEKYTSNQRLPMEMTMEELKEDYLELVCEERNSLRNRVNTIKKRAHFLEGGFRKQEESNETTGSGFEIELQSRRSRGFVPVSPERQRNVQRPVVVSTNSFNIDKSGFLWKEGKQIRNWKKRWCVLKSGNIFYARAQNGGELGSISLAGISCDKVQFLDEYKKRKSLFTIDTPKRKFYLQAENERETLIWIQAVKEHIRQCSEPSRKLSPEDFEIICPIGKGSFGRVYQAKKKDNGKYYAMKVLEKKQILENDLLENLMTEKGILQNLVHPFLVHLYFSFQTANQLFLVMEYVPGGDLLGLIERNGALDDEITRFYSAEILCGLEYIHANGIIYRDLKSENILIRYDGHICLTDFGIAKDKMHHPNAKTKTFCGSPDYLAPEILNEEGYNKAVDYWAFGCLIYEMLTGLPPFYCKDINRTYGRIQNGRIEYPDNFSAETVEIISNLLQRDNNIRATDPQVIKNFPYFSGIDWEKILRRETKPPYIPDLKDETDTTITAANFASSDMLLSDFSLKPIAIPKLSQETFNDFSFLGGF